MHDLLKKLGLSTISAVFVLVSGFGHFSPVVRSASAQTVLPDLTVDSIAVTPTSPELNESVTIVVTGHNSGSTNIEEVTGLDSISYLFDNFDSATSTDPDPNPVPTTTDPLVPDEVFTYTFEGMFTATGTQDLEFTVDSGNTLDEDDEENNTATSTVTVVEPVDETPPVISNITVTDITDTSAVINWDTDEDADSLVFYGLTDAYGTASTSSDLVMDHALMLSGLTASTTYHYMVSSEDESGNEATSTDRTFTTSKTSNNDDDDDDDDDGDDDDDDLSDSVLVCHYNNGRKGYNLIRVSRAAWENGHSKHTNDYVTDDDHCSGEDDNADDDDDDDDSSNEIIQRLRQRIKDLNYRISNFERQVVQRERQLLKRINRALTERLKGQILLQVEENGEAWYVDEDSEQRYYLQDGRSAYQALQAFGLGITNKDLEKIPIGLNDEFVFEDTDGDGLPDKLEDSLGSDPENPDSDGDGIDDKTELLNDYDPAVQRRFQYDNSLTNRLTGKILLQVEGHGEAWWINPSDGKRYYMKDGDTAYNIMRFLSLGINNDDLSQIDVGSLEVE